MWSSDAFNHYHLVFWVMTEFRLMHRNVIAFLSQTLISRWVSTPPSSPGPGICDIQLTVGNLITCWAEIKPSSPVCWTLRRCLFPEPRQGEHRLTGVTFTLVAPPNQWICICDMLWCVKAEEVIKGGAPGGHMRAAIGKVLGHTLHCPIERSDQFPRTIRQHMSDTMISHLEALWKF